LLPTRLRTRGCDPETPAMSLQQHDDVLDVGNPFTRADARAAGITVKELISSRYQKFFY